MLIAVLAVFLCLSARKRVHVVGSDAKLVQRDFDSFSGLFRAFAREVDPELPPERFAVLCGESQAPPASGGMHGGIWAPPRGGVQGRSIEWARIRWRAVCQFACKALLSDMGGV